MNVIEESHVPATALPIERFKDHLRLGRGFAEDTLQDSLLEGFLRAALAAIEARTGKALIRRDFLAKVSQWGSVSGQAISISPVQALSRVTLVDQLGNEAELDMSNFVLGGEPDMPRLCSKTGALPRIPAFGSVEIRFVAGMVSDFSLLQADLAQAVMLLAAHYYEYRDETALGQGCMPFGVTSLIARYRPMRLGFVT